MCQENVQKYSFGYCRKRKLLHNTQTIPLKFDYEMITFYEFCAIYGPNKFVLWESAHPVLLKLFA